MKTRRCIVLGVGSMLGLAMVCFPPWVITVNDPLLSATSGSSSVDVVSTGYAPLWEPPELQRDTTGYSHLITSSEIDVFRLTIQLCGTAGSVAIGCLATRQNRRAW